MKPFLIIFCFVIYGCNANPKDAKESTHLVYESKTLLENNELEKAEIIIEKAINLDNTNYAAFNNRAILKSKQNKSPLEVIADYQKALTIKPDYEISLFSITNYFLEIKSYKHVISSANIYLDYSKKNQFPSEHIEHIYAIRGEAKYMTSQFKDAIEDLVTALQYDSTSAATHKTLGDCYFYLNFVPLAITEFEKAIAYNNNYYQPFLARARSYEKLKPKNWEYLAENDYKSALKINPNAEDIYDTNSDIFKRVKGLIK